MTFIRWKYFSKQKQAQIEWKLLFPPNPPRHACKLLNSITLRVLEGLRTFWVMKIGNFCHISEQNWYQWKNLIKYFVGTKCSSMIEEAKLAGLLGALGAVVHHRCPTCMTASHWNASLSSGTVDYVSSWQVTVSPSGSNLHPLLVIFTLPSAPIRPAPILLFHPYHSTHNDISFLLSDPAPRGAPFLPRLLRPGQCFHSDTDCTLQAADSQSTCSQTTPTCTLIFMFWC